MSGARGSVVATFTLTILVIAWCLSLAADPRLRIDTRGRFVTGPASVWVIVTLEPEKDDRWLDVIADGSDYSRSSGYSLAGERSFHLKQHLFRDLPPGCYAFLAEVRTRDENGPIVARAQMPGTFTVLGFNVDATTCGEPAP